MRSVNFGNHRSAEDWGLILNAMSITPPTPKTSKISVEGRDGDINLSRALTGEMRFSNREASFTFLITDGTHAEREALSTEIISVIHGEELKIITPDKLDYYLIGECKVEDVINNKSYMTIIISADCEPYFFAVNEIRREITLSGNREEIALVNHGRKTLTPAIHIEGNLDLVFDGSSVSLGSGDYQLANLQLKTGTTLVTVSGSGSVTFTYREAVL